MARSTTVNHELIEAAGSFPARLIPSDKPDSDPWYLEVAPETGRAIEQAIDAKEKVAAD